jgi:hypothetical protein
MQCRIVAHSLTLSRGALPQRIQVGLHHAALPRGPGIHRAEPTAGGNNTALVALADHFVRAVLWSLWEK